MESAKKVSPTTTAGGKKPKAAKTDEPISIEEIFGAGGLLEKRHPGYEFRASQLEMAQIADDAFQKHQHVVIEAGTEPERRWRI